MTVECPSSGGGGSPILVNVLGGIAGRTGSGASSVEAFTGPGGTQLSFEDSERTRFAFVGNREVGLPQILNRLAF
jgi:hypothetical protein